MKVTLGRGAEAVEWKKKDGGSLFLMQLNNHRLSTKVRSNFFQVEVSRHLYLYISTLNPDKSNEFPSSHVSYNFLE